MASTASKPLPAPVEEIRSRVERWRATRAKLGPIPEDLWAAAVALAATHGVYAVARALRLSYNSLRDRAAPRPSDSIGHGTSTRFVELSPSLAGTAGAPAEALVEPSDADGSRLTIRLPAGSGIDLSALVAGFWSRRQ